MQSLSRLLIGVGLATGLSAQVTVDYPDSVINSPQGQYPIYTPTTGSMVRGQIFCPSTFAGLPQAPMVCTKVGVQIAGKLPYTVFLGRAGITSVPALTNTFATNLPDQRKQWDLSGQNLPGGGSGNTASTQINVWVEFDLCHPFVWTPGDNLVVDITAQSQVAGQYCRSAIGGGVSRMLNTAYTNTTTTGTPSASGGIKVRFVFEPLNQPIVFGTGCPGTNKVVPVLSATGNTQVGGGVVLINLSKARANALSFLAVGGTCIDLPIFGGCYIYPNLDLMLSTVTAANGTAGTAIPLPNQASLIGAGVTMQYAVDDPNTAAAPLSFSLSNGLRLLLQK